MKRTLVLLTAVLLAFSASGMSKKVSSTPAAGGAANAASDFKLNTPEGKEISLGALKGKVVLINFWATWCPYCVKEMPDLTKLYEEYGPKGFEIVAIDVQETPAVVKEFVKKKGLKFTTVIDPTGEVARAYKVFGIPTNVLIDKQGNIVFNQNQLPGDIDKTIEELLKAK